MAISSAARTGLISGTSGPSRAIFTRLVCWLIAAARMPGFGVIRPGE